MALDVRVHALLLDGAGSVFAGPDGAAPSAVLELGETPLGAARRALGVDARWIGTVHSGADSRELFVVLVLASAHQLADRTVDVPGGAWTLERARAIAFDGTPPPERDDSSAAAERRQLTVLFCDLVGSTALSQRLDAEELRDHIATFQRTCAETVARFDGFVARYMGDGLLAYFGYPRAWGDDAERAVRAGLALVSAVASLDRASVRVGIATGEVVVGDVLGTGAAQERVVVGETPNLAARLQALARPGEVLLSSATRALALNAIELEEAGEHTLRGFSEPVPVWRALRAHEVRRDDGALVGREGDLMWLRAGWARQEGAGLTLVGEAGVGKTRLVEALIAGAPGRVARWQASPWHGQTALHPVVDDLRRRNVDAALVRAPPEVAEPVRALLGADPSSSGREQILDALAAFVVDLLGPKALVVIEDAQWADPSTLSLLDRLVRPGVLVVATQRPGGGWSRGETRVLGPLEDSHALAVLAGLGVSESARMQIAGRAGGNPLFLHELARLVLEGGADTVPSSLKDVLSARLGRGRARAVAREAAAFRDRFSAEQMEAVHPGASPALAELLDQGVLRQLDDGRYEFRHALLRDAAYETLLKRDRVTLHGRIADVMGDGDPEQLALHLEAAERYGEAVHAWEAAAQLSARRFASIEAAAAYARALDAARRAGSDARTLLSLGVSRAAHLRLFDNAEATTAVLDEAEREGAGAGDVPELATLWFHRGNLAFLRGDVPACRAAHERALAIARAGGWKSEEARAWGGLGDAVYAEGRMSEGRDAFARCVELSREAGLEDVLAAHLPMVGMTSFFLGDLDRAESAADAALERMAGGAHRGELLAGVVLAGCAHLRGGGDRARIREILRPQQGGATYHGFRCFGLSLVADSLEQARADVQFGLDALERGGDALGQKALLLARHAALDRDPLALAECVGALGPPGPVFARLFGIPQALHAARLVGEHAYDEPLCAALDQLAAAGTPWAQRVAAWARGGSDTQMDVAFPNEHGALR